MYDTVLIAVGGTPEMPAIPGIEHAIQSDDFFDLEEIPKKVAVIGSGYIAVELAGIMNLLGAEDGSSHPLWSAAYYGARHRLSYGGGDDRGRRQLQNGL